MKKIFLFLFIFVFVSCSAKVEDFMNNLLENANSLVDGVSIDNNGNIKLKDGKTILQFESQESAKKAIYSVFQDGAIKSYVGVIIGDNKELVLVQPQDPKSSNSQVMDWSKQTPIADAISNLNSKNTEEISKLDNSVDTANDANNGMQADEAKQTEETTKKDATEAEKAKKVEETEEKKLAKEKEVAEKTKKEEEEKAKAEQEKLAEETKAKKELADKKVAEKAKLAKEKKDATKLFLTAVDTANKKKQFLDAIGKSTINSSTITLALLNSNSNGKVASYVPYTLLESKNNTATRGIFTNSSGSYIGVTLSSKNNIDSLSNTKPAANESAIKWSDMELALDNDDTDHEEKDATQKFITAFNSHKFSLNSPNKPPVKGEPFTLHLMIGDSTSRDFRTEKYTLINNKGNTRSKGMFTNSSGLYKGVVITNLPNNTKDVYEKDVYETEAATTITSIDWDTVKLFITKS